MSRVPLRWRWLLKSWIDTNHQVFIKSKHNWLQQEIEQFFFSEIIQLFNSVWNKKEMFEDWKKSIIYPSLRKVIKQKVVIIEAYYICQLRTNFF